MHPLAPEHRQRIEEVLALLARAGPGAWPGHLRLQTAGHQRDVLLGSGSRAAPVVAIEWQSAPLAEVFFDCEEGARYELEIDRRAITGVLERRHLLGYEGGALAEIRTPEVTLRRGPHGWSASPRLPPADLRPRPERLRRVQPWQVELDPAQRRLVELPAGRPLLLLGEAGFGKTTVALHRLARLRRQAGPRLRTAAIVPTEGLRVLTASLLERMGLGGVPVFRFDQWAARQARLAFKGLPKRESSEASAQVIKLKRHPALRAAIAALVQVRRKKPRSWRRELEHLFGDSAVLAHALAASNGQLGPGHAREVLEHTHVQFSRSSEKQHAHVTDETRLEALDGRGLDEGTPLQDAGTLDAEDYAVLFELDRLRAQRTGAPPVAIDQWDCLLVDEAQELAPVELALIGRALAPGGSLIAAGDAAQQLDDGATFGGWQATMAELGAPAHEAGVLEVNYRCPPEVTALARRLRDDRAAQGPGPLAAQGPGLRFTSHRSELHLASWLCDELRALRARDPGASVAVVCRGPEKAARLHRVLGHALEVRLALGGHFDFRPGVHVTCVPEVKGLEFDHVIVPDASASTYPDTPEARRSLYVALTRACHQLVLASPGRPSPLLEPALEAHGASGERAEGASGAAAATT